MARALHRARLVKRSEVKATGLWRWPLLRQLRFWTRGTGVEVMSARTRALRPRTDGAEVTRSICPYCAVGCGQLVYQRGGKIVQIEGDPESPISQGNLCPKGAASRQLLVHERRETKEKHRRPFAREWEEMPLAKAMDRIAELVWETRERTFVERSEDGSYVNHTTAITHLGGATLDDEENYLIKKLFTGGLGLVAVSNQARI